MANQTRHPRRIIAPPPPAEITHPVPPDPTSPATIQDISHRFSKLYANHKTKHPLSIPTSKPYKHPSPPPPRFDDNSHKADATHKQKQEMVRRNDEGFPRSGGVKVLAVDMPSRMQIHALECAVKARHSLQKKFTSKTLALTLKKEFDGAYGPAWHCIVGASFGSFVTHSLGGFIYFSLDPNLYVLLFQTSVRKTPESN